MCDIYKFRFSFQKLLNITKKNFDISQAIKNHLFYIIFNIFWHNCKSYGIPYYMHAICTACFAKMAWWWSIDRNMSSR